MSDASLLTGRVQTAGRLDRAVAELAAEAGVEMSRSRAAGLVKQGEVTVDTQVVTRPSQTVHRGQEVAIRVPAPAPAEAVPQDLPLTIVFEDEHLAVVDKAAGMVVHAGAGHPDGTLVNALLFHLDGLSGIGGVQRPGIVHRLDRGTSGLMVVAKHDASHQHLARQFAAHTAGRTYLALCHNAPDRPSGTVHSRLARHPKDRLRFASTPDPTRGKEAITHWRREAVAGTISLLSCTLETGRTHQVRVHLAESGWPLVGDRTYQPRRVRTPAALARTIDASGARPMLHAWQLHLDHPADGRRMELVVPPPPDFLAALAAVDLAPPAVG